MLLVTRRILADFWYPLINRRKKDWSMYFVWICKMFLIDKIAEEKIKRAIDNGELQDLPGAGKPLNLDDDTHVPAVLRAAYRLLKNAGYLPPEMALRKEIARVESLLKMAEEAELKNRLGKKLEYLLLKLSQSRQSVSNFMLESRYLQRLKQKLS